MIMNSMLLSHCFLQVICSAGDSCHACGAISNMLLMCGLPRYPAPYPAMVRPVFPPRPPGPIGVIPAVARPPVPGIPGVRPIITPVIRPAGFPVGTPAEKPETTVYVGKIASTADNDFMLSLLQVCGPVKSWKRPQHPSNGTLKGFGFCEFESAEGVLRALRLLSKFNVDGQELMLNVTQATKDYLERYVEKKTENTKKLKETHEDGAEKEDGSVQGVEKKESPKASEDLKDSETGDKENHDYSNFGIVTDEDREMDQEGSKKLKSMIEERLKANPLPPPPSQSAVDDSGVSHSEVPAKNRDGDSDVDILRNDVAADKIEDETASDSKATSEHERPETSSPDRRTYDRRSRDRDRERDLKREKEREIDRYEREAERERVRKEREQRRKIEDAEREYERCLKDWEYREREKEKERQYEKERAKERERKRKKEILYDEEDEDDDSRKRWRRSVLEDKKRKRLREKEDDFMDKIKEEEEIAEAKKRAEEEQLQQHQRDALKLLSGHEVNGTKKPALAEEYGVETKYKTAVEQDYVGDSINEKHLAGDEVLQNGTGEESMNASVSALDMRQSSNTLARKLGFGLVGSGKRAAVPSVFHEEEDDDAQKEKKMRPLVPIDYSTEELQAAQPIVSGANQPNLAAAAEFAKHISNVNSKEEKLDSERERSRRSHDRSGQREKDRSGEDNWRTRDENKGKIFDRDRDREHGLDKVKTPDNKKLLDAKQLIDMIPKTKEELFSHEINWAVYDEHELHERMRPWISKKITEFLGEEETTLVDYIVSSTQEHVKASQMLELLQTILDDEAEMFVLKMWRMLIFEIKKVETGLAVRSRS
ncbi:RNA-binding protein 25-like isoform X2 [Mangifera indica]|uniref:RNA-binding protein 25-like isoform X2 n=1 Tax=Mangifera indica TaxID=29780 RepID=UPI001CF9FD4C|nr:RNA-binding protein 25-like isoform X2 [Mangifera indica]XP_044488241.1 RNA-binding protein 25-like isoform X2 [Mangifera indica]XP_044488242.1 RNA-binding protein 25-like isoform X2 [Mangifera indica]XP_044488244.1 RNA-binding protein 25-like isoform X2 [Mangifera indica]XP_044488245.1 RNA-binding protein 25-like isoform X2 [Mangifera indica]XP_044488246.1 RNA-binding protein 25-like isoform X2 [Mangifera indica]XP_044488247.1 RNA-binding protein 25-like isoform X2 [Mangifera indica]XP_0